MPSHHPITGHRVREPSYASCRPELTAGKENIVKFCTKEKLMNEQFMKLWNFFELLVLTISIYQLGFFFSCVCVSERVRTDMMRTN